MKTCTFLGHHDEDYSSYQTQLEDIFKRLICQDNVTTFYTGYRGNFDLMCCDIIANLKTIYKDVKLILSVAFDRFNINFKNPMYFDDYTVPIKKTYYRGAINQANRDIIFRSDFIVSGIKYEFGEAYISIRYARKLQKRIIQLKTDE